MGLGPAQFSGQTREQGSVPGKTWTKLVRRAPSALCCSEADFAAHLGCWESVTTCRRRSLKFGHSTCSEASVVGFLSSRALYVPRFFGAAAVGMWPRRPRNLSHQTGLRLQRQPIPALNGGWRSPDPDGGRGAAPPRPRTAPSPQSHTPTECGSSTCSLVRTVPRTVLKVPLVGSMSITATLSW